MSRTKRTAAAVGALTALISLTAACSGGGGTSAGGTNRPVTVLLTTDVDSLDPVSGAGYSSLQVYPFMYDTLISYDQKTQKVSSQLAEKWNISARKATFTLKKNVTCGDGSKLTASTVAANFNRMKDPQVKAPLTTSRMGSTDFTATADDASRTVTIKLGVPNGFLARGISRGPFIICQDGLEHPQKLGKGSAGTGPYTLSDASPGDHYTFKIRKGYAWGPGGATWSGLPPTVTVKVVPSEATQINLLRSGQADLAHLTLPTSIQRAEQGGFSKAEDLGQPMNLMFNQRPGRPGSEVSVRRALAQALDRDAVAKVLSGGLSKSSQTLLASGAACTDSDAVAGVVPKTDPAAAKKSLAEAGWLPDATGTLTKDGKPLSMTLLTTNSPSQTAAAELIKSQWAKLGVKTSIDARVPTQATSVVFGGKGWDATISAVGSDIPAGATAALTGPVPPRGLNYAAIDNQTYAAATSQARGVTGDQGCALWQKGERALLGDSDVVPLTVLPAIWFGHNLSFAVDSALAPTSLRAKG